MQGVKRIEGIFKNGVMYEAPRSVVQIYGDKRESGAPRCGGDTAPQGCFGDGVVAQEIQDEDKSVPSFGVVAAKAHGNNSQPDNGKCLIRAVVSKFFVGADAEKSQEKRKEDILISWVEGYPFACEVERYLRYQGEQKEVPSVVNAAVRVGATFHEKEAKNGEG